MISVQQAVAKVLEYYESLPSRVIPTELLVEEVEFSEKENCYFVTLGYNVVDTTTPKNPIAARLTGTAQNRRDYKIFKVDAETGFVPYMKIRKI